MAKTKVELPDEQLRTLKHLSDETKISMDELIRSAINLLIEASRDPEKERRVSRAIAAAGKFKSGKSDISVEHDKYLEEDFDK
ncbi:MAG: ribbon-helix-helix domain-containing protein [Actinobacteria bacterium]|nr:ribbon-helix-helix domain-containing protein [Actinomycetota bacterium]